MFGLLNIDKPQGMTSRDVVNVVQRVIRPVKVGHAGTLDPLATGVLILPVGRATRLTDLIHKVSKTYVAIFELGKVSETEDIEGEIEIRDVRDIPDLESVQRVVAGFCGRQLQRPPAYSALKINGKRAYSLARRGEKVELKSREIEILQIRILTYDFPILQLEVECTSGTYIRSLGRDIGEQLNTGAVMTGLRRTAIGNFTVEHAIAPDFSSPQSVASSLHNPLQILDGFHRTLLNEQQQQQLFHGRRIDLNDISGDMTLGITSDEQLLSVLVRVRETTSFQPAKNFFDC